MGRGRFTATASMLFPSPVFLFVFLPITLGGAVLLRNRRDPRLLLGWLTVASMIFYGWWNPPYVVLLTLSILVNYAIALRVGRKIRGGRLWLIFGITANLALLGYYKYASFFVDTWNEVAGTGFALPPVFLPLAISFFTFQQISYLVDSHRGVIRETSLLRYVLFVSFFPQLIAGPIVHHREMVPQFSGERFCRFRPEDLSVGFTMLAFGLFKKVLLADQLAPVSDAVFAAAASGVSLTLVETWCGALAFTFQIYFDFSAYSDMAVGLGRLFGVRLPENFNSPFKATSIIDFWSRWNMTLSRFLRDYLYFPLFFSRRWIAHVASRRVVSVIVTMLLGGLWHGAGWTFVLWGALHGLYMIVNGGWRALRERLGRDPAVTTAFGRRVAQATTFLAIVASLVIFRATSLETAGAMYATMAGARGLSLPMTLGGYLGSIEPRLLGLGIGFGGSFPNGLVIVSWAVVLLGVSFLVVFFLPNTQELLARHEPTLYTTAPSSTDPSSPRWEPTRRWAWIAAAATLLAILNLNRVEEFVYFQF